MSQSPLNRAQVEQLVRQSLARFVGQGSSQSGQGPNPLVVNISARHCHLSQKSVEVLFGKGHQLTPKKWLYQEGQYAAEESVTLIGPRSRVISNLRILGPCRDFDQVELAATDAISLGFDIPVRNSGDIAGTPGCMLMGPAGFLEMNEGVIRAAPHVHMAPEDAAYYGVENKSFMKLRIGGDLGLTFDKIFVRVDPSFKLEVHIDTDEGNACGFTQKTPCELIK
ncbi:phosphate propanoyltransferase [Coraliomargarita sp. SDUM461004]|uniref:Phosphate propanoyltransferase n=1 Tax=Thalassobacterium sedimentorum TaxID=3041258 RepID=A0ABU1AL40_9BACT|nr:phosphate propanoyltransferase [Coraliomargarita sp. SDUM461004]MDQ8194560.1 phosphate propanoyltransferase [Coraliomargarita sp. SDUM461004]